MKYLQFTIAETSARTFEVPYDKAVKLVQETKAVTEEQLDDYDMARILMDYCLDDIAEDEKYNDYFDMNLTEHKFIGED